MSLPVLPEVGVQFLHYIFLLFFSFFASWVLILLFCSLLIIISVHVVPIQIKMLCVLVVNVISRLSFDISSPVSSGEKAFTELEARVLNAERDFFEKTNR